MVEAIRWVAAYQKWVYGALAVGALLALWALWQAQRALRTAQFGLEREAVLGRRRRALLLVILAGSLGLSAYVVSTIIVPNLEYLTPPTATAASTATAVPSTTPVLTGAGPGTPAPTLAVNYEGCGNPLATLSAPASYERIVGTYEVQGTANIANFAFYKFEIAGDNTGGAWVPLRVGTTPVPGGTLGSFDASAYPAGDYAFRLVVMDTAGNSPLPCVVVVTFAAPVLITAMPSP